MQATQIIFVKVVVSLTERGSATIDLHNVVHHFDRIMSLLKRKCKGRCSLKLVLEEYCAFRLVVLYFEKQFEISFDDEARLVEDLMHVVDTFEGEDFERSEGA